MEGHFSHQSLKKATADGEGCSSHREVWQLQTEGKREGVGASRL